MAGDRLGRHSAAKQQLANFFADWRKKAFVTLRHGNSLVSMGRGKRDGVANENFARSIAPSNDCCRRG